MNTAKNSQSNNLNDFPDILPVWQPVGYSTYQITNAIAKNFGVKAAHTGVLDPLAEGVIIVLLREQRLKKIELAGWKKTYEFDIAFGLATDSYDGMGLVTNERLNTTVTSDQVAKILEPMQGDYTQNVPLYSAKKLNGLKMFDYPRLGKTPEYLPTKSGQIYSIELTSWTTISLHDLINKLIGNISKVGHGEFRQTETAEQWQKFIQSHKNVDISIASIRAELSRGLYVRSLSQDICSKLNTVGFVSKLVRTQNGEYTKANCFSLQQVCGKLF